MPTENQPFSPGTQTEHVLFEISEIVTDWSLLLKPDLLLKRIH